MRGSAGGRCVVLLHRGENQCVRQRSMAASAFGFGLKLQEVKAPVVRHVPPERIQGVDEGGKKPEIRPTSVRKRCTRIEERRRTKDGKACAHCSTLLPWPTRHLWP